ncbi:MAG: hypothetical protein JO197_02915 [Acidobacteria bacterium]|nr:hypothetical protein [Acidobacteriota bacterium]MBV9476667.1 hypothetical protein [Acidobacteriota bacterium]
MIHALLLTANLLLADDAATAQAAAAVRTGAAETTANDAHGFAHDAVQFKFTATDDGGSMELRAKDTADLDTIDAIQKYLKAIAGDFATNDFSKAESVNGRMPEGVDAMERLHDSISYGYEALPDGGRMRLQTGNADAVAAIRAFLKFQTVANRAGNSSAE